MVARLAGAAAVAGASAIVYAAGGGPILAAVARQLVRELR